MELLDHKSISEKRSFYLHKVRSGVKSDEAVTWHERPKQLRTRTSNLRAVKFGTPRE